MRPNGHVFQLYRVAEEGPFWWRLLSPNGRGVARCVEGSPSSDEARASIREVVEHIDALSPVLRVEAGFRWRWMLEQDGVAIVQGVGDHDRRVRCDQAWRRFVLVAPIATVDNTALLFRRGARRPITIE